MKTAFCFDLDGTITHSEVLPFLAREINLFDEMEALTMATICGHLPFDKSFKLRVRILNTIPISRVRSIIETIPLHKKVVDFLREHREQCFIVTGNLDVWINALAEKIGIEAFSSKADFDGDRLLGVKHILNKGDAVDEVRSRGFDRIVGIGDGMGDVPMFAKSNVGIAYGGIHDPAKTLIENSDFIVYSENSLCRTLNTLL